MLVEVSLSDGRTVDPSGRLIFASTAVEVERDRVGRLAEAMESR